VIIITAFASLQITIDSIKLGAHNFLTKPFQMDELHLVVNNAATLVRLSRENRTLREQAAELARALEGIERQHGQLAERLSRLEYEGVETERPDETPVAALNTAQAVELRRRRMRDQVAAYRLAGENLGRQIEDQRGRLQGLLAPGAEG
jgi:response regulator RpfG family c-di-GMP phosphodiesterase